MLFKFLQIIFGLIMKTILFLFLFVTFLNAQRTSDSVSVSGKYALQFQISENFKLSNLQGTILSGKYHFTNSIGLRVGISGNYNSLEQIKNDQIEITEIREQTLTGFEIKSQVLIYFPIVDDITFFIGTGPLLNIGSSKQTIITKDRERLRNSEEIKFEQETEFYRYGLEFICGTEWFVKSNISLFPEIGFSISHREETYFQDSEKIQIINNDLIQSINSRLGVSIYF